MIEKLDIKNGGVEDLLNCIKKINELVDAVNEILDYAPLEMAMKAEPKTPADPYAEQRKWIGKLCWFWDDDKKDGSYGVLNYIKEGWESCYVQKGHYCSYKHCEPVKADDNIIYKGVDK